MPVCFILSYENVECVEKYHFRGPRASLFVDLNCLFYNNFVIMFYFIFHFLQKSSFTSLVNWSDKTLLCFSNSYSIYVSPFCLECTYQIHFYNNLSESQKFNSSVGTLPQLEPPVVQVMVSNAKNQQQQSDSILPQIANKGGPNNYQTQSVRLLLTRHP